MRSRARRWVAVLGAAIVGLILAGMVFTHEGARRPAALHRRPASFAHISATAADSAPAPSSTSDPPTTGASATVPAAATTTTTGPPPPLDVPTTRSPVNWVEHKYTITFQGLTRQYLMYRPATVSATPLPVVVELAGCCVTAQVEANRDNFKGVAGPAILVYPAYYQQDWNAGACCGPAAARGIDDPGFVNTVIDRVRAHQPDASQGPVYLAGYSNGGKLAMEMACQEPSAFLAVAVFGATRTTSCTGPPAESVLVMAGTADSEDSVAGPPIVQNGFTQPTVNQLVSSYVGADGCAPTRQTLTMGTALIGRWAPCAGSHLVQEVLYQGADHNWPAGNATTPSAEQVMWDFFAEFGA